MWLMILKYLPWLGRLKALSGVASFFKAQWRIGVAVLVVGLLALAWWRWDARGDRIDELEAANASLTERYELALDANAGNQTAILRLKDANERLRAAVEASEADRVAAERAAADRAAAAEERLEGALGELERLRSEDPSCEEIARLDIGSYCPGSVERLRELSRAEADSQD